ncbi:MAG TPA: TIR domain-containing protein [Gemmatimonadaceae bacterium]|jgi:hypothetical protein|nr:TIR domain-containing protein [Gemmatimonadaceae bacterium]
MIERFRGKREVLIDSLKEQKLVRGDATLATRIADVGELVEVKPGVPIMSEGDTGCDVYPILWTDGVFVASRYPVESLEQELDDSDFGIAIASPDDIVESRGKSVATARDNVVFEIGLFIGRLGRKRSLLLEPHGEAVKLPSDLSGITTIAYKPAPARDLAAGIGPAVNKMRDIINELGPK